MQLIPSRNDIYLIANNNFKFNKFIDIYQNMIFDFYLSNVLFFITNLENLKSRKISLIYLPFLKFLNNILTKNLSFL